MQTTKNLSVLSFQETEIDVLATVQNLLRQCGQPSAFLRPLSKLFSVIHNKLPRQALTNVFQVPLRMELDELIYFYVFIFHLNLLISIVKQWKWYGNNRPYYSQQYGQYSGQKQIMWIRWSLLMQSTDKIIFTC